MASCPVTAPAFEGLNITFRVWLCPGCRVIGKTMPDIENPLPANDSELTVSADEPVEVRVKLCVPGTLSDVVPKFNAVALTPSAGERA